ncbi:hypothetical protein [Pricia sp.]|uniref:hypothetical protein n=1 Tax=Pricia sp. TaxID=2268138 RepID=UPI003594319B
MALSTIILYFYIRNLLQFEIEEELFSTEDRIERALMADREPFSLPTPLAIIQAKIENIINGDTLNDGQYGHLTSIQKDIQRLTQMNKRLTLLTKIENRHFVNIEKVALAELMNETIQNFHEITAAEIKYNKKNEIWAKMDPYLAEVLCTNLVSKFLQGK